MKKKVWLIKDNNGRYLLRSSSTLEWTMDRYRSDILILDTERAAIEHIKKNHLTDNCLCYWREIEVEDPYDAYDRAMSII